LIVFSGHRCTQRPAADFLGASGIIAEAERIIGGG
jgi:hypothetical protein